MGFSTRTLASLALVLLVASGCSDDDDDDDLAFLLANGDGGGLNFGGGGFNLFGPSLPDLLTASHMVDVDGDNDMDIIVGTQGETSLTADVLLENDGTGEFSIKEGAFPDHYKAGYGSTVNITSADFNSDGNIDIVATTVDASDGSFYETSRVHVYLGNGDGTFTDNSSNMNAGIIDGWPEWVNVADFDGDGHQDLLLTISGCPDQATCFKGGIWLNDGTGGFSRSPVTSMDSLSTFTNPYLEWDGGGATQGEPFEREVLFTFVDDLTGDGLVDIITPNGPPGPTLPLFVNNSTDGELNFTLTYTVDTSNEDFWMSMAIPGMTGGVLIDVDGDGNKDIVGALNISGIDGETMSLSALINQGDNTFVEDNSIFSPTRPGVEHARQWLAADFNGDGYDDVLVADHGYDYRPFPGQPNLLLLSDGNGKLVDRSASNLSDLSSYTHGGSVGDVDGDGDIDIFLNNAQWTNPDPSWVQSESETRLWLNDGTGNFTEGDF